MEILAIFIVGIAVTAMFLAICDQLYILGFTSVQVYALSFLWPLTLTVIFVILLVENMAALGRWIVKKWNT